MPTYIHCQDCHQFKVDVRPVRDLNLINPPFPEGMPPKLCSTCHDNRLIAASFYDKKWAVGLTYAGVLSPRFKWVTLVFPDDFVQKFYGKNTPMIAKVKVPIIDNPNREDGGQVVMRLGESPVFEFVDSFNCVGVSPMTLRLTAGTAIRTRLQSMRLTPF